MTELRNSEALSAAAVAAYLKSHPEFLRQHPKLLQQLNLSHDTGQAVSLIEHQNTVLRTENRDLTDRLNQFIDVAKRNDRLFTKLQSLVLQLLSCDSAAKLGAILRKSLVQQFEVDRVQLILTDASEQCDGEWRYQSLKMLADYFPAVVKHRRNECGEFTSMDRALVFGDNQVRSMALAALTADDKTIGMLVLGSYKTDHYRYGTDTLFLDHLARVVGRLLQRA